MLGDVRSLILRSLGRAAAATLLLSGTLLGQTVAKTSHPKVCAKGVVVYHNRSEVPTPHDTVSVPPADHPVRVTSPEEAEAAELAMRGRAGSVGATGVLVTEEREDDGSGVVRMRRSVQGLYVPSDSARVQRACAP
ncbi:MAG TPA: hypothetical protein VHE78_01435 [Gemmatimonadaceae bacterium]|nr:hypothetical protein [Gemmatimonadaceae bacterium]